MVNPNIAPIANFSPQGEAVAGSSAAIFTATDRQLIKEIGGQVENKKDFKNIFKSRPLTAKVENEECKAPHEQDLKVIERQYRQHQELLKDSPLKQQETSAAISKSNDPGDRFDDQPTAVTEAEAGSDKKEFHHETMAIAKELNLKADDLYASFKLEQAELFNLVSKIKELHLKRLLSEREIEFVGLTKTIKQQTLAAAHAESRAWLANQLDKLTHEAVQYKLEILHSLQGLEFDPQREANITWLEKLS